MSVTVVHKGLMCEMELTGSAAALIVPQTDPKMIVKFGPKLVGQVDLSPGEKLPYRLALISLLRDAWLNNRQVEIWLNLTYVIDTQSNPPGLPVPIDENWPYVFGRHQCFWGCERVIARSGQ